MKRKWRKRRAMVKGENAWGPGLPPGEKVAEAYDRVVEVAAEVVGSPRSTRIKTFDDGTLKMQVWHAYSAPDASGKNKEILWYHSANGWKVGIMYVGDDMDEPRLSPERLRYEESVMPDVLMEEGQRVQERADLD